MNKEITEKKFVNVYEDDKGKFISDAYYKTFADAFKRRDLVNYIGTVELIGDLPDMTYKGASQQTLNRITQSDKIKNIPNKIYLQVGDDDLISIADDFKELSEVSWCQDRIYETDIEYVLSAATPPDVEQEVEACGVCGNKKVEIRGRFPKDARRLVCPTCAYERLEQINELSSKNYGQTYTNHQTAKQ